MAAAMKKQLVAVLTVVFVVSTAAPVAGAETHHVVGGDRGWDVDSDISSWSAGRTFRVGDKIWFAYSVAHGNIVELQRKEEYDSCDVNKYVRRYSDGIDIVPLIGEGIRYFASSQVESCKKGLKLHVQVQPQAQDQAQQKAQTAGVETSSDVADADSAAVPPAPIPSASSPSFASISYLTLTLWLLGLAFTIWIK